MGEERSTNESEGNISDISLNCSVEGCHRKAGKNYKGLCRKHYDGLKKPNIPKDLGARVVAAKTAEDWQKLAEMLAPIIQGVADGTIKSTAAQTAMLKDIMSRAYGKPVAIQEKKTVAAGIIVLPALDTGEKMSMCPRCGYELTMGMEESRFTKLNNEPKNSVDA